MILEKKTRTVLICSKLHDIIYKYVKRVSPEFWEEYEYDGEWKNGGDRRSEWRTQ